MKIIIAGSRGFNYPEYMERELNKFLGRVTEVVSGEAAGADTLGKRWAIQHHIAVKCFPAKWKELGKGAGYARNIEMARYADELVTFWDGKSRGTAHMIRTMEALGKIVWTLPYE